MDFEFSEPLMDFNFPELLADNLGLSENVFLSKNLTAGAPAPSLVDDGTKRHSSLQSSSFAGGLTTPSQQVLSRMRSLQDVNQEYALAMARASETLPRKSSETTSSESSGGMEPPSVGTRDVSINTTSTSLTSSSRHSPREKTPPSPVEKAPHYSWVDLGHDDGAGDRCYSMGDLTSSPPRTFLSPSNANGSRSMSMGAKSTRPGAPARPPSEAPEIPKDKLAAFLSRDKSPSKLPPAPPTKFPERRSSLRQSLEPFTLSPVRDLPAPRSAPPAPPSPFTKQELAASPSRLTPPRKARKPAIEEEARSMLSIPDEDGDSFFSGPRTLPPLGFDIERATTPQVMSSSEEVERWLESSSLEFSQPRTNNTRMPIPTEILDTLRISVACFPETMLLCTSLSIETIRSHSRKIRYRAPSLSDNPQDISPFEEPPQKQSKWKWLTTKRPQESPPAKLQSRQNTRPNTAHTSSSPDWQAIKNIFPSGTDHLCNALYAHLLAYNYITYLCPRAPAAPAPTRPTTRHASHGSDADASQRPSDATSGIPPKASALLGLEVSASSTTLALPPSRATTQHGRPSSKAGKRDNNSKPSTSAANRPGNENENMLKDLRLALAKCIARLVGTLRLTTSDEMGGSTCRPVDIKDVDPLFIRALCEIVRCCEERF
jgi:hypothetical protein